MTDHLDYYKKIDLFFESYNLDTNLSYDEKIKYICSLRKNEFRYFCFFYLDNIRKLSLKDFASDSNFESVLIEYRIFPHIEFLIRNMIDKLNSDWCHTIICGNLNYNFITEICNKINPKIKIIKTDFDNLTQLEYSNYLCTINFWNLLNGKKILLYQEDSCIFKNNIDEFIKYDFIGAPNRFGVNGGFCLRTKQTMIDCIKFNNESYYFPEDVYFSKTIMTNNIGIIADFNNSFKFSTENIYNIDSLGGHQFWNCDINWKNRMYKLIQEMNILDVI